MAHQISESCTFCGRCAEICPMDAISEKDGKYQVDPNVCDDCGECEAMCAANAIAEK